jgi:hypothetical protein
VDGNFPRALFAVVICWLSTVYCWCQVTKKKSHIKEGIMQGDGGLILRYGGKNFAGVLPVSSRTKCII